MSVNKSSFWVNNSFAGVSGGRISIIWTDVIIGHQGNNLSTHQASCNCEHHPFQA